MAIVTATITVDFTANYAGDHRVCFRIQGSGDPYDCTTIVNCVGGATACQAIINTDVNTTSCDGTVTFEGYVQAVCEDILSTSGRLLWTTDFVPNVVCERWEILCDNGPVDSFTVNAGGYSYLISDTVVITRDGADTETGDATATITAVGDGVINSITGLLAAGTNYAALDTIDINDGFGAAAQIRVDTVGGGGDILTFTLIANGSGYIGPFGPGAFLVTSGAGTGADFDIQPGGVDYDVFGTILGLTLGAPGTYQIPPAVTITTGTGNEVDITAVLQDCPTRNNIGNDCIGGEQIDLASGLPVGTTWATCIDGGINAGPAEYVDTQVGCCIPEDTAVEPNDTCTDYHIDNTSGGPINIQYTECRGDDQTVNVPNGLNASICAVTGGVIDPGVAGVVITASGACS